MYVDLNSDLGESFGSWKMGNDEQILPVVSSANIACGFHAGDPLGILKTLQQAVKLDVTIGAHVSYPDLVGFGRRNMDLSKDELIICGLRWIMNLKNLEAFYWVVTLNSFNKAATKLQTTQPAISQKITAIENDLGFKVLDRSSRQIKATHKGMTLFKYAEKFMRLETDLVAELTESQYLTGTIRLGVSETIVHTWLVEYMEQVQQEFPKVSIEIVVNLTPDL